MKYQHLEQIINQRRQKIEDHNRTRKLVLDVLNVYLNEAEELQQMGIFSQDDSIKKVAECYETLKHASTYPVEIFNCKLAIRYINQARK